MDLSNWSWREPYGEPIHTLLVVGWLAVWAIIFFTAIAVFIDTTNNSVVVYCSIIIPYVIWFIFTCYHCWGGGPMHRQSGIGGANRYSKFSSNHPGELIDRRTGKIYGNRGNSQSPTTWDLGPED